MAALPAILEPRAAARHVSVDDHNLVVDTLVRRARDAKAARRRTGEHLDEPLECARERLHFALAADGCRMTGIVAVHAAKLVGRPLRLDATAN